MDMMERRIRDAVAALLSKGARALERTAGELEQAAGELRRAQQREQGEDAEHVWSESGPPRREPDATLRSAPLRAVPNTPTDEAPDERAGHPAATPDSSTVPPVRPPQTPPRPRPGQVDADIVAAPQPPGTEPDTATPEPEPLRVLATGTVSAVRAQLGDLTADELRTLRSIEESNRNRTTLLSAIDRALLDS